MSACAQLLRGEGSVGRGGGVAAGAGAPGLALLLDVGLLGGDRRVPPQAVEAHALGELLDLGLGVAEAAELVAEARLLGVLAGLLDAFELGLEGGGGGAAVLPGLDDAEGGVGGAGPGDREQALLHVGLGAEGGEGLRLGGRLGESELGEEQFHVVLFQLRGRGARGREERGGAGRLGGGPSARGFGEGFVEARQGVGEPDVDGLLAEVDPGLQLGHGVRGHAASLGHLGDEQPGQGGHALAQPPQGGAGERDVRVPVGLLGPGGDDLDAEAHLLVQLGLVVDR